MLMLLDFPCMIQFWMWPLLYQGCSINDNYLFKRSEATPTQWGNTFAFCYLTVWLECLHIIAMWEEESPWERGSRTSSREIYNPVSFNLTSHYARWWCSNCAISAHSPAHTKLIVWSVLVASDSVTVNETMAFFSRFLRTNLCEGKYLLSLFTVHSWMMGAYGKEKSDI